MQSSQLPKQKFYNQPDIAQTYHEQRFGGASGAWVNAREIKLVLGLVPAQARVLDLGCGTGRLTRALSKHAHTIGMDAAQEMLNVARAAHDNALVQGDAFALPFDDASFDAVAALRVVFHFAQLENLLREMRRVIVPGGALVFDTYLWSPRAILPLDARKWGSSIFIHSPHMMAHAAHANGLRIEASHACFLFSPYLYRRLPLRMVHLLEKVEARVPASRRARIFWKLTRAS